MNQPQFNERFMQAIQSLLLDGNKNLNFKLQSHTNHQANVSEYEDELWNYVETHLHMQAQDRQEVMEKRLLFLAGETHFRGLAEMNWAKICITFGVPMWSRLKANDTNATRTPPQNPPPEPVFSGTNEQKLVKELFRKLVKDPAALSALQAVLSPTSGAIQQSAIETFLIQTAQFTQPLAADYARMIYNAEVHGDFEFYDTGLMPLYHALW